MSEWKKLLREPVAALGAAIGVFGYLLIELGDSAPRWLVLVYGVLTLLATKMVRARVTPVADPRLPASEDA
jgi:hypothetical protein